MPAPATTLYQIADEAIRQCIDIYLKLAEATDGFTNVKPVHLKDETARAILLAGLGLRPGNVSPAQAAEEWKRRLAIPFDLEQSITTGVYTTIREEGAKFLDEAEVQTDGFRKFDPDFVRNNPYLLPIFLHLSGAFSKEALKRMIGSVSDTSISKPASIRLAGLLTERVDPGAVNKGEILKRLESTLEGIVRDLVGRVLLESLVNTALLKGNIPFKREEEYDGLRGVIYDFRADFVLPDDIHPKAFIEVRKSSTRHASLYAKDKMFSVINWKGNNRDLLGVLVVHGEWTKETLRVMAKVFDYVVPIARIPELVETLKAYLEGDKSKLKWLIDFRVSEAKEQ